MAAGSVRPAGEGRDWTPLFYGTLALCLFIALVGLHGDVGSHLVFPRDTFWEPPHIPIYAPLLTAGGLTLAYLFYLQRRPGEPAGEGVRLPLFTRPVPAPLLLMATGFFLIPAGGLFDQWWHANLGERETLYSLSHIFTIMGGAMAGLGVLLAMVRAPNGSKGLFLPLFFGGFLVLAGLMMGPFDFASSPEDFAWFREHRPAVHYGFELDPRLNQFETSIAWDLHRQNGLLFPPLASAAMLPLLALLRRMSSRRWAATEAALFYTAVRGALAFLLSPETGRWPFLALPLPAVAPALLLDLLGRKEKMRLPNGAPEATASGDRNLKSGGPFVLSVSVAGLLLALTLLPMGTAPHPLGLAGAAAAGAFAGYLSGPVASLLLRITPRQTAALVLLLGLGAPVALGLFDLRVRGWV